MSLPHYPNKTTKDFGEAIMSSLYDASIRQACAGLGGCKEFNYNDFPKEHHSYIRAYLEGNNDSLAICYAAMRAKEAETTTKGGHHNQ